MYRLKNKERGLYVDFHVAQGHRLLSANPLRPSTYCVMFPHPYNSFDSDTIPDKATVSLEFHEIQTAERKGYAYPVAKDAKNQYLFCSQDYDPYGLQMLLTLKYE